MHVPKRALSAIVCLSLVMELIPVNPMIAYGTEDQDDASSYVSQELLEEPAGTDEPAAEDELGALPEDDEPTTEAEIVQVDEPATEAGEYAPDDVEEPDAAPSVPDEVEAVPAPQEPARYYEPGIAVSEGMPMLGDAPTVTDGSQSEDVVLAAQASAVTPAVHTQQEIIDFIENHPFDLNADSTYSVQPSTTAPYASGELSPESIQEALNVLNTLRFIAGVGSEVTNSSTYQSYAQAAALVGRLNGSLSHSPAQPAGLSDELYNLGYEGAGSSNIAYGKTSAALTMLQYCDDLGSNNQGSVGHRRWLLSSRLGQVGIGQVDRYNATYVVDSSDPSVVRDVAWPARQMPTYFFDSSAQWSFATVTQDIGSASSISVTVTRRTDGKTWELSSSDITVNEVGSNTSFVGYDKNGCIVWSLDGVGGYYAGDIFDVTITGDLSSKSYSVEFFDFCAPDQLGASDFYKGTSVKDETVTVWVTDTNLRYLFEPGYSDAAYPTDPTIRSFVDDTLPNVSITYTSSNPNVATVQASGVHEQERWWNLDHLIWGDWLADITPVGVGTTTITATASNGTTASFELVVRQKSIDPAADSQASISVSGDNLTYNGNAQHPTYAVRYNNALLSEGTDYQIVYDNDVNAGTGTATITGMGEYVGEVVMEFTIKPASLSSATIAAIATQTYTGSEIVPAPVVTLRGKTLVAGTDYTVTYANNTKAGTAVVTVAGKGNYSNTRSAEFTIRPLSFDEAESVGISIANVVYTGESQTPEPVFSVNDRDLVRDVDYTVSYSNNTNAGDGRVTVTGKGNYTGTYSGDFTIEKARISAATISAISGQVFTGSEVTPDVTVTLDGKTLKAARDYSVIYGSNVNAGTATVRITGEGNYTGSTSASFTILKASMSDVTIQTIPAQTYTGSSIEPDVVITYGGKTLSKGTDYTVAYTNNIQIGVATVTIEGQGNFEGSRDATFHISNVSMSDAKVEDIPDQYYTGDAKQPELSVTLNGKSLTLGTDYEVSYADNVDPGTATATITGIGIYGGSISSAFEVTIPFVDANLKTPHVGDIGWLAESGISVGWKKADGTVEFRPTNTVVRQDMAAFLFRLAKLWGLVDDGWQPTGSVTFTDVNEKTPHYTEIMWLAESGVSAGWTMKDGSKQFRPKNTVVRQDMAAFLRRLQALRDPSVRDWKPEGASPFRDVTASTPHYEDILWLAESGVSAGWTMKDGSKEFRPKNTVIRQDMAAFLRRLDGVG